MSMVKSFPFPVLSPMYDDYEPEHKFCSDVVYLPGKGLHVSYSVSGNNLVSNLIFQGKATLACNIAEPKRLIGEWFPHHSSISVDQRIDRDGFQFDQVIDEKKFRFGGAALKSSYFFMAVVAKEKIKGPSHNNGLKDEYWKGREVSIPKGGLIAFDGYRVLEVNDNMSDMLVPELDNNLSKGSIGRVKFDELTGKIVAFVASDIYEMGKTPHLYSDDPERVNDIWRNALTEGFADLAKNYWEDWEKHPSLIALTNFMQKRGVTEHWSHDKGEFIPIRAATALYPYLVPTKSKEDDD